MRSGIKGSYVVHVLPRVLARGRRASAEQGPHTILLAHTPALSAMHGALSDFRTYVTQPYLLITTLRNPLELFVSGLQFKHRNETQTLDLATSLVGDRMRDVLR